ncbi:MAG: hypothetical protein DWQ07_16435 [Chloroflexi bacterium]|nr:MAG: hypothetical protein DWQ07_16435 [Chloroflexota bacterium]MBL1195341.1 hypothetical protein [Chloroflexota bacterium]NOH12625.1 hypothetical protein [Chloroflexota bacterium]
MSYTGNQTIAYLVSSVLGAGIYSFFAIQKFQQGDVDVTTISRDWGSLVLIVIAVQVAISIVTAISVTIIQAIKTREPSPELSDERDKLFELRAGRISYSVFGVGFLIAMITLAAGLPPLVMFNIFVFSLYAAAIIGYLVQLYLYRRGF